MEDFEGICGVKLYKVSRNQYRVEIFYTEKRIDEMNIKLGFKTKYDFSKSMTLCYFLFVVLLNNNRL